MKGFTSILSKVGRPQLKTKLRSQRHHGAHSPSHPPPLPCRRCSLHVQCVTTPPPLPPSPQPDCWPSALCSPLPADRRQADKLATGRTAALHGLPSSIFWRHWYFPFLPGSFSLAFHTKSQFSFPDSSGKVLVDSYGPKSPLLQHMIQMMKLYNQGEVRALWHILLKCLGDKAWYTWSLNSLNRF